MPSLPCHHQAKGAGCSILTGASAVLRTTDVHHTAKQRVQSQSMAGRVLLRCVQIYIHFCAVLPLPQPEVSVLCSALQLAPSGNSLN